MVAFPTRSGMVLAVNDVSFRVEAGRTLGLVGEFGCGKSMTLRAILGLVPYPGEVIAGSIRLRGRELRGLASEELRAVRGLEVAIDLPGSERQPRPGVHRGRPDRRDAAEAPADGRRRCRAAGRRAAGSRRHLVSDVAPPAVSAPAVGRHAPARDDRACDRHRSERAPGRRADDGPGRHDPGPDPRPAGRDPCRDGHGHDPRLARRRRDRPELGRGRGHVRGPPARSGTRRRRAADPTPSRTRADWCGRSLRSRSAVQRSGSSRSRASPRTSTRYLRDARSRRAARTSGRTARWSR